MTDSFGAPKTEGLSKAASAFFTEMQKLLTNNPYALKKYQAPAKIHNVPNVLPLTGAVGEKIGTQGLIYMNSVLRYCQYYKKAPPVQRFM